MNENDVEKLLSKLPKPKPLAEIEQKRLEKLIRAEVSKAYGDGFKQQIAPSRFNLVNIVRVAAAFVLVISGAAILINSQSSQTKSEVASNLPSKSPSVSQSVSPTPSPSATSNSKKSVNNGTGGSTEFGAGNEKLSAYIYQSGNDYAKDLTKSVFSIKTSNNPLPIGTLSQVIRNCENQQGIADSVFAIDKGFYDGERAQIFYLDSIKSSLLIVDSNCKVIKRIN